MYFKDVIISSWFLLMTANLVLAQPTQQEKDYSFDNPPHCFEKGAKPEGIPYDIGTGIPAALPATGGVENTGGGEPQVETIGNPETGEGEPQVGTTGTGSKPETGENGPQVTDTGNKPETVPQVEVNGADGIPRIAMIKNMGAKLGCQTERRHKGKPGNVFVFSIDKLEIGENGLFSILDETDGKRTIVFETEEDIKEDDPPVMPVSDTPQVHIILRSGAKKAKLRYSIEEMPAVPQ